MARKHNIALFLLLVFVDKMVYIHTPTQPWCVIDILLIRFFAYRLAAVP